MTRQTALIEILLISPALYNSCDGKIRNKNVIAIYIMEFLKTCVTLIKEQLNVIKNELQLLLLESDSAKNSDTGNSVGFFARIWVIQDIKTHKKD